MNNDKKQLARNLFFQTQLTKTQIAAMLGISRRSITYWSKEDDWQRLKASATHLPSLLAEKCYHLMGQLTDSYLSERRLTSPVTPKEVDALYKLTLTINKLKNRSTLNESMEMFGFFLDGLRHKDKELAATITPHIEEYISSRAAIYATDVKPDNFTGVNDRIPWIEEDKTEQQIDNREAFFSDPDIVKTYADAGIPLPSEEEISTLPEPEPEIVETREEENARWNKVRLAHRKPWAPAAFRAAEAKAREEEIIKRWLPDLDEDEATDCNLSDLPAAQQQNLHPETAGNISDDQTLESPSNTPITAHPSASCAQLFSSKQLIPSQNTENKDSHATCANSVNIPALCEY